ncbi:MAG TPA: hypothetical protein VMI94_12405 [Bryobacteraceae bacterium]|nr:hypothetical protein [Bryobacteraceae bacterium]
MKTVLCLAAFAAIAPAASSIFQVVRTPNENFNNGLLAISASSPNDIWAVGQSTIHYDGTAWTAFPAPGIKGNNTSNLGGVYDVSPTEAWAVGTTGITLGNLQQVIEHWDGSQWSVYPGPTFAPGDQPSLNAMTGIAPNDIWAVGSLLSNNGQLLSFLFEHWDGTSWTATTIPSGDAFLLAVSAAASNDVWAVGFTGPENDSSRTLVMHYDGKSWRQFATPSVGSGANQFNSVVAMAPNDVWAVGFSMAVPPPKRVPNQTLIEHWNGSSWAVVSSPNVGPNSVYQSNTLYGVTAVSSSDVWAFGSYFAASGSGHQMTLLEHWDGSSWTIQPSPNPGANGSFLSDILFAGVCPSPGDVWIVGAEDHAPYDITLAIHSTTAAPMDPR